MDKEPQFNMSPEKLEGLRRRHEKEQKEAGDENGTPISEIDNIARESFAANKKSIDPSPESIQFIEEEGRMFSGKQIEIAKISAFFFEKCAEAANLILRNEREKSFSEKDAEELSILLSELDKKYEDILQKPKEYGSALEVISELRENIPGFIEKNSNAIFALFDIAKRINAFHHSLLGKEGKSEYKIQAVHHFLEGITGLIIRRIPSESLKEEFMFGEISSGKGEVAENFFNLSLPIPPRKVLEFEDKIKKVMPKKPPEALILTAKERSLTSGISLFGGSVKFSLIGDPKEQLVINLPGEKINLRIYLENGMVSIWCEIKDRVNQTKIKKEIQSVPGGNWSSFIEDIVKDI